MEGYACTFQSVKVVVVRGRGAAVLAGVAGGRRLPVRVEAGDAHGAERGDDAYGVPDALELGADLGGDGGLDGECADGLVVDARGVDGLAEVPAEGGDAEGHLQRARDDGRAAGAADHEDRTPAFEDDRRRHARLRALSRGEGVRGAAHEAVDVRHVGGEREVVHLVVQDDSGARDEDAGAEGGVDRRRDGGGVALGVDGGDVRGAGIGRERRSRRGDPDRRDQRAKRGEPGRGEERGDGHGGEVGVAVPAGSVREALGHRLGQQVQHGRGPGAERGEVVVREETRDLEHDTAGARGRKGDRPMASEPADERTPPAWTIAGEVVLAEHAAPAADRGDDRGGARPPVEGGGSARRHPLEGGGEIGLAHDERVVGEPPLRVEERRAKPRVGRQERRGALDLAAEVRSVAQPEAVARQADGRVEDDAER